LSAAELVWFTLGLAIHVCVNILSSLLDITSNIESVTRSLGNGETVVESDASGDGTETDENTPHLVNGQLADTTAGSIGSCG